MTREQIDAIRARVEADPKVGEACFDSEGNIGTVIRESDRRVLLAEVERLKVEVERLTAELDMEDGNLQVVVQRLTAEVVAKTQQNVALIGQNGRLQQEVERLNALGTLLSADIQRLTRRVAENEADWLALRAEAATAFQRGVTAMREAAAMLVKREVEGWLQLGLSSDIRALPDPEDK